MKDGYPRFANYVRKQGDLPFQWTETGAVYLKTESERQFLMGEGYVFPDWESDGIRSAEILKEPKQ